MRSARHVLPELPEAMSGEHDLQNVARLAKLARWCFSLTACVGAFMLARWPYAAPLDHVWLQMRSSSALGFVLLGFAMRLQCVPESALHRRARQTVVALCVVGAELLAVGALINKAFELDSDLDLWLMPGSAVAARMSPYSAVNLALLGVVCAWMRVRSRSRNLLVRGFTLTALFLALGALAGHGYGVRSQHAMGITPMLPLTALCFTALSVGVLAARVAPDVASLVASRSPGSSTVRRLLASLVSIPIGLGFAERFLYHRGLHQIEFGVAMLMVANMLLVFGIALRSMRALLASQRARAQLERDLEHNREIAARYQAQQALQRSEEKYRALAVHAPVGIFEASLDGRCVFVNERWTEITGYSFEEALGTGWNKVLHPDDSERFIEAWSRAIQAGTPFSVEYRLCTKSSQVAWVHGSSVPLKDSDGKVTGMMGTIVDMTERKRTLEALSQSEANFRSLVENAPFGVLVSRDQIVVYANRTYLTMMGYEEQELIGTHVFEKLIHPDMRALALARDEARRAGGGVPPMTFRCLRKDGSEIALEGSSATLLFDGELSSVSVARDVTERERAEQVRLLAEHTMRESLREKDVLLKEIHHRVKNNLQVIVSLINLQASKLQEASARSVFEETRSRVHAIALLHERLYSSKNLGRIDMRDYLEGLASDLSSSNFGAGAIDLRVRADELFLEMDAAVPIGLIVNELVTNSFKHAFPHKRTGCIEIALERSDDRLQIAVEDDGAGYPDALDPDTTDSLGLLLISSLSRQLEGELSFTQRNGGGASCTIRFPWRERDDDPRPASAAS